MIRCHLHFSDSFALIFSGPDLETLVKESTESNTNVNSIVLESTTCIRMQMIRSVHLF